VAYCSGPRRIRNYLRARRQRQSVAQLAFVKAVDANDETVLAKCWQRQARKVGRKADVLIVSKTAGCRSADVERELYMKRA
jgi:hypothetical protein